MEEEKEEKREGKIKSKRKIIYKRNGGVAGARNNEVMAKIEAKR